MTTPHVEKGTFTGRHMLVVMIAFFTVIISVNVLMATLANTTWSGLVVQNSYVASQQFNRKAAEGRAQAALGWTGTLTIADGEVGYRLSDQAGRTVPLYKVTVTFRHPAYDAKDMVFALAADGTDRFVARQMPTDGVWIVDIEADAGQPKLYRDIRRITVAGGALK
jgi:nitrogen fixation protein FixH